jgi:transcriptional regulator with XRE-family HTH domain
MFSCNQLTALRGERGLSRSDLHRALVRRGFERCRALINRWEAGTSEPTASEVALLAETLHVPVASLFDAPTPA